MDAEYRSLRCPPERLALVSSRLENLLHDPTESWLITFSTSAVAVCAVPSRASRLHLVEQPRVLDRDHGLIGESPQQLDVMIGENGPGSGV